MLSKPRPPGEQGTQLLRPYTLLVGRLNHLRRYIETGPSLLFRLLKGDYFGVGQFKSQQKPGQSIGSSDADPAQYFFSSLLLPTLLKL
jgi:hypothetical protein